MNRFLPRRAVAQEFAWLSPKDSLNEKLIMNKYDAQQNKRKATETPANYYDHDQARNT